MCTKQTESKKRRVSEDNNQLIEALGSETLEIEREFSHSNLENPEDHRATNEKPVEVVEYSESTECEERDSDVRCGSGNHLTLGLYEMKGEFNLSKNSPRKRKVKFADEIEERKHKLENFRVFTKEEFTSEGSYEEIQVVPVRSGCCTVS
eukprot:1244306-Amorphochlora_amoeboformis.AAC.2